MNKNILFVAALAATLSLGACDSKKSAEDAQAEAAAIEANAAEDMSQVKEEATGIAEYTGTYEGTIAQADGEGYVTTLVLNADNTFTLTQAANGGKDAAETQSGSYIYTEDGALLTLTAEDNTVTKFSFQGDKVVMVGADGTMPESPEMYTLLKKVM